MIQLDPLKNCYSFVIIITDLIKHFLNDEQKIVLLKGQSSLK